MTESTIAFESPADQAGFVQLPNVVLLDADLSMQARLMYALLIHYARSTDSCYPGQAKLGAHLGVSARMTRDYLRELEAGMLVRTERRGNTSNVYVLLALGLRAKRLADAADGKSTSAPMGSLLPPKDMQLRTEKPLASPCAVSPLKVGGRRVNAAAWALAERVLAELNRVAGRKYRLLKSSGQPSQAATYVYKRIREYPDLTFEEHASIIERTVASGWWGAEQASFNVIYGPTVFEGNITRAPRGNGRPASTEAQDLGAKMLRAALGGEDG